MYYCKAERQGRVKAYAGAPDQKSNAPSRGIRFCRTTESDSACPEYLTTETVLLRMKCLLI